MNKCTERRERKTHGHTPDALRSAGRLLSLSHSQSSTTSSPDRRSRRAKTTARVVHIEVDKVPLALSVWAWFRFAVAREDDFSLMFSFPFRLAATPAYKTSLNTTLVQIGTMLVRSVQGPGAGSGVPTDAREWRADLVTARC